MNSISGQYGFEVGDNGVSDQLGEFIARFEESSGRPARALSFGFEVMKISWNALPDDIRNEALNLLRDAAMEALDNFGDQVGDIPIAGWIIDFALMLFQVMGDARRGMNENNQAYSAQEKNKAQNRTFGKAKDPTNWIYAQRNIDNYMDYTGTRGDNRWRLRPSIDPTGGWAAMFGLHAYVPTGSCKFGKPYRSPVGLDGEWKAKDNSKKCRGKAAFSALFYPFWSPDHTTKPIVYHGIEVWPKNVPFKDDGVDPNLILIKRQVLLLSDPVTNLQANGAFLEQIRRDFIQKHVLEELLFEIDPTYDAKKDFGQHSVKLFLDANGLMRPYGESGLTYETPITSGTPDTEITIAKYNCVIGMTRAFFTARAAFLTNEVAMAQYVKDGRVKTFDPAVRKAVKASARPKRKAKGLKKAKGQPVSGGGAAVVGIGLAAALVTYFRR